MSKATPSVSELLAEHDRMQDDLERLSVLADALARDDGFDELQWMSRLIKGEMDHHFPTEEKLAAQVLGADDELVTELRMRHRSLATHYGTLLAMVQDIGDDVLVDRELFDKTLRGVVAQMKSHLDFETRVLLPRLTTP